MKRKIFAVVCSVVLAWSLCVCAFASTISENKMSGTFGESLGWSYDPYTAKLVISGEGEMPDIDPQDEATYVESYFECAENARSVVIENGVANIGDYAFFRYSRLTSVEIADSVTEIGNGAFSGCGSLESIQLPEGVTEIGEYAFDGCYALKSIDIPDSVGVIGHCAFFECYSLESVSLHKGLKSIESMAFACCKQLESLFIPDGTETLGGSFILRCNALKTLSIPKSVTVIGSVMIESDNNLEAIYYSGSEEDCENIRVRISDDEYTSFDKDYWYLKETVVFNCCDEHELDGGAVTVEPAHAKNGLKVYSCKNCEARMLETLDMTDAHYFVDPKVTREPTHTVEGVQTYTCEKCGETSELDIEKLPDCEWTSSKIKKEPTETEEGIIVYYCECGKRKSETIPKLSAETEATADGASDKEGDANEKGCMGAISAEGSCVALLAACAALVINKRKERAIK